MNDKTHGNLHSEHEDIPVRVREAWEMLRHEIQEEYIRFKPESTNEELSQYVNEIKQHFQINQSQFVLISQMLQWFNQFRESAI